MPPGSRARRPPSPRSSRMRRLLWRGRRTLAVERLHLLDHVMVLQEDRSIRPRGERVLVAHGGNAGVRGRDRRSLCLRVVLVLHRVLLDHCPDAWSIACDRKDTGEPAYIPWYRFERAAPRLHRTMLSRRSLCRRIDQTEPRRADARCVLPVPGWHCSCET